MKKPILEARQVSKQFPGSLALDRVNLQLYSGEILALVGENGAGKSTLMRILAGEEVLDSGQILVDGVQVTIESVQTASLFGIAFIHQELNLSDNLDVSANIFLGRECHRFGFLKKKKLYEDSRRAMDQVGLRCSPTTPVSNLCAGHQQLVEIARALAAQSRVLIMDEPTSSLSQEESRILFQVVRGLRNQGVGVIYISHRLGEVVKLADRVLVLRDGSNVGELSAKELNHKRMVQLMVGRNISGFYGKVSGTQGPPILQVQQLATQAYPQQSLSFNVKAGEILGITGLLGSGRSSLLGALFGTEPPKRGTVSIAGKSLKLSNPSEGIKAGIALIPEDRKKQGLILQMAVGENISLTSLERDCRWSGFLNRQLHRLRGTEMIGTLKIRPATLETTADSLSGGNQQKVVLAKWLSLKPRVLLMDEPTRGIDIGSKEQIYHIIETLSMKGVAILFVSSEIEEIMGFSHRVLVMHEGRITGELLRHQLNEEAISLLATASEVTQ